MGVHVFGIRHHGPGCARALRDALEALAPDVVLVEGPPDANEMIAHVGDPEMTPPVALLVHAVDDPQRATFYPFAEFSPEWQALRYAVQKGVPARFMDLPCANVLARRAAEEKREDETKLESADAAPELDEDEDEHEEEALREDPLGMLAEAAGFADRELWWDLQVERRRDATGLFEGILEAMSALREQHVERRASELQREAHMRTVIRAAQKEGFQRIAVVCGAWHAPALATMGPAKADAELLRGLPKIKVSATWVPWSSPRLALRSGYGAGVDAPGWYAHLWSHFERASISWTTQAARLLREADLDASVANVIDTVRLADALASLRGLPSPGLTELRESIESVLCGGEHARLALIRDRLEVGRALGRVPSSVGQVPLVRDFEREAKRLRMKLSIERTALDLDLRKENDRDRSRLLHRLAILEVPWGTARETGRTSGTFKEAWEIAWTPELAVDLIAANVHGQTVERAAAQVLAERARTADLSKLSAMIEQAVLSALPTAIDELLRELDARAASSGDVRAQMEALGPLARLVRYGDVRETRVEHVRPVVEVLLERVVVGLAPACTQLDDDAAGAMLSAIGVAHAACLLLADDVLRADWLGALRTLLDTPGAHARLRGRACRLLLEQGALQEGELERRASLALGPAIEAADAARWIEGLVAGEGLFLVHQEALLATLDGWLSQLADDAFQAQLPLLRRAFSSFEAPERRAVAQRLKERGPGARRAPSRDEIALDPERVARVLPVLAHILGAAHE